jgi:hypothetical protein
VASVRESVAALRVALLAPTPELLESQIPALEQAIQLLRRCEPQGPNPELRALAAELRTVAALIEHGITSQHGWARLLAASLSGYQPDGEPSPLTAPGSISITG